MKGKRNKGGEERRERMEVDGVLCLSFFVFVCLLSGTRVQIRFFKVQRRFLLTRH